MFSIKPMYIHNFMFTHPRFDRRCSWRKSHYYKVANFVIFQNVPPNVVHCKRNKILCVQWTLWTLGTTPYSNTLIMVAVHKSCDAVTGGLNDRHESLCKGRGAYIGAVHKSFDAARGFWTIVTNCGFCGGFC